MNNRLVISFLFLFFISCESQKADMIIHNGMIYTMNDLNSSKAIPKKDKLKKKLGNFFTKNFSEV